MACETELLRSVIAAACAYETVAITTRRTPTISMLCWRLGVPGKVLAGVVLAGLGLHFYYIPQSVRDLQRVPALRRGPQS